MVYNNNRVDVDKTQIINKENNNNVERGRGGALFPNIIPKKLLSSLLLLPFDVPPIALVPPPYPE